MQMILANVGDQRIVTAPLLQSSRTSDCRCLGVLNLPRTTSSRLDSFHNVHRFLVSDLAKNDMLPIEPGSHDSGDEELFALVNSITR